MKQETLYRCEVCNTAFNDKDTCEKCERGHRIPKEITSCRYRPTTINASGYPDRITVEFDDGETISYTR